MISIDEKDIAGSRQRFYVLRILDTDRKIMVPVSNANAVGLRQVISEQEIREIFDILKERTIGFDTQTWNRRYRGFMDKIKTGSIYDVAEVLRDLYRLKANKQLSFGERRMLDTARSLIVKEIAIAREQTEDQVEERSRRSSSRTDVSLRDDKKRAVAPAIARFFLLFVGPPRKLRVRRRDVAESAATEVTRPPRASCRPPART